MQANSSTVASGIPDRQPWFATAAGRPWFGLASGQGRWPAGITPGAVGEHGFGDGWKRENLRGGAEFHCFAGHAVDYASVLILCDGVGAGLAHFQQTLGAIVA